MQGLFLADVVVDAKGHVIRVEVINELDQAIAAEAVRNLKSGRFKPAYLDGQAVAGIYRYRAQYRLD